MLYNIDKHRLHVWFRSESYVVWAQTCSECCRDITRPGTTAPPGSQGNFRDEVRSNAGAGAYTESWKSEGCFFWVNTEIQKYMFYRRSLDIRRKPFCVSEGFLTYHKILLTGFKLKATKRTFLWCPTCSAPQKELYFFASVSPSPPVHRDGPG